MATPVHQKDSVDTNKTNSFTRVVLVSNDSLLTIGAELGLRAVVRNLPACFALNLFDDTAEKPKKDDCERFLGSLASTVDGTLLEKLGNGELHGVDWMRSTYSQLPLHLTGLHQAYSNIKTILNAGHYRVNLLTRNLEHDLRGSTILSKEDLLLWCNRLIRLDTLADSQVTSQSETLTSNSETLGKCLDTLETKGECGQHFCALDAYREMFEMERIGSVMGLSEVRDSKRQVQKDLINLREELIGNVKEERQVDKRVPSEDERTALQSAYDAAKSWLGEATQKANESWGSEDWKAWPLSQLLESLGCHGYVNESGLLVISRLNEETAASSAEADLQEVKKDQISTQPHPLQSRDSDKRSSTSGRREENPQLSTAEQKRHSYAEVVARSKLGAQLRSSTESN
ncbi:hypothetical protein M231_06585 [Tremella mesenterica]|uniref:Uncharacterized protein n=1 Tax=Tremella mesenterica TaxID=5217 RepID=A0A4Q1BG91_TREME|nr:hypothetical protein M231_06585 [Tremella mesenterica]